MILANILCEIYHYHTKDDLKGNSYTFRLLYLGAITFLDTFFVPYHCIRPGIPCLRDYSYHWMCLFEQI